MSLIVKVQVSTVRMRRYDMATELYQQNCINILLRYHYDYEAMVIVQSAKCNLSKD